MPWMLSGFQIGINGPLKYIVPAKFKFEWIRLFGFRYSGNGYHSTTTVIGVVLYHHQRILEAIMVGGRNTTIVDHITITVGVHNKHKSEANTMQ